MAHTQIASQAVTHSPRPSDSEDGQKIAQCIRHIKLINCVLIVIVALCIATIGVLSWHIARSVRCQDEAVTQNELNSQTEERKSGSASTYTRWGRSDCPPKSTELVYDGYVGGSIYTDKGGASNYVCLTKQPRWGHLREGRQYNGKIYGAEYEFGGYTGHFSNDLSNFNVPCAVCRVVRPTVIMIPGRNKCFNGWTLEYHGYLAADNPGHYRTEYVCIDKSPATVTQNDTDENGVLFYIVEAMCGSLNCPPYVDGAELTCVVCSK